MQPFQCDVAPQRQETHRTTHTGTSIVAKHIEGTKRPQPLPFVTTSLRHHFPSSPPPFVTTSHRHHFPSSPLPFVTTSHRHHFPSSPLPFVTTSHRHHFPSSPLPIVTTSLRHHFPSSPLPFVTLHVLSHHPSCKVSHHPSSRSSLNVMYCYVMKSLTPPFIKVKSQCDVLLCHVKSHTTLHQGQVSIAHHPSSFQVSEFYLSVTRKYCFPTSFDNT